MSVTSNSILLWWIKCTSNVKYKNNYANAPSTKHLFDVTITCTKECQNIIPLWYRNYKYISYT